MMSRHYRNNIFKTYLAGSEAHGSISKSLTMVYSFPLKNSQSIIRNNRNSPEQHRTEVPRKSFVNFIEVNLRRGDVDQQVKTAVRLQREGTC